jgi:hypothetical protein
LKNVVRLLILASVVSFTMLSNAHAGSCVVRCTNGTTWSGSTATGWECCAKIETFCGGAGRASYNGAQCAL